MPAITPEQLEEELFRGGSALGKAFANGEYLIFTDGDDRLIYSRETVKELVEMLADHYGSDRRVFLGTDGKMYRGRVDMPKDVKKKRKVTSEERAVRTMLTFVYDKTPDEARGYVEILIQRARTL